MNQFGTGSRTYLVRLAAAPEDGRTVSLPANAAAALERGARLLFYEQRGDAANPKASLTGWASIDKLTPGDDAVTVSLRDYVPFRPRIPFGDLRTDPRRNRDVDVQPITIEVFNAALAKARR